MINPDEIPYEVEMAFYGSWIKGNQTMAAAIAAAINAWPRGSVQRNWDDERWLDLPLPDGGKDD